MKRILALSLTGMFLTAGCALSPTEDELHRDDVCRVWKKGLIGQTLVSTEPEEKAQQKITCWVMNTFLCSYTDYTFRDAGPDILSSLPPADKAIGHLKGRTLSLSMTGADVKPFEIGKNRADFVVDGIMGQHDSRSVEFNNKCTTRQVALGVAALIGQH